MDSGITLHSGIGYANHDGIELLGALYLPQGAKSAPALVAVHGGGWVAGVRSAFQYWGPYLAAHGIAVFAISSAARQARSASMRRASACSALPPARTLRRSPRSAAKDSPATIRGILLPPSIPA